jgi:hypothetical protein
VTVTETVDGSATAMVMEKADGSVDGSETETEMVDGSETVDSSATVDGSVTVTVGGSATETVGGSKKPGDEGLVMVGGSATVDAGGTTVVEVPVSGVGGLTTENRVETADSSSDSRSETGSGRDVSIAGGLA